MNLKEFLEKNNPLTERERELVINAWIEASGVFEEGTPNEDTIRVSSMYWWNCPRCGEWHFTCLKSKSSAL
jgi:hypothetical protein